MIRMIQKQLIIPRGDTGTFSIPILTTSSEGDASIFTIFDPLNRKKIFEKVMEAENGVLNITFTHADTVNLPVGSFVWDIKFYKDAEIVDGVFINGTEVDSYYAAFKLPVCEIRQTGDTLLMADDAPTSTIAPDQLNIILAATDEINTAKREVINAAEVVEANTQTASDAATSATADAARAETAAEAASTSASAASQSATDASNAKDSAVAANTAAQQALLDANLAATIATTKATEASASATAASSSASAASNSASAASSSASEAATSASNAAASVTEMEALVRAIPTNVSEFENDAGYITAAALPTKISDLTDDSGHYTKPVTGIPTSDLEETYLTQHQDISMKANSADLATVATSGSYEDLINKPFIPIKVSDLTDDSGHYTKPAGGIPASDLANGVLDVWSGLTYHISTMSTDSDSFVLGGATDAPTEINKCLVTSTPDANVIPKFDYQGRLHSITPEDEWDGSNAVATTEYVDNMISDNMPEIPTNVSELNNDAGYITGYTETDPTVPAWAKAAQKPSYTAAEVGAPTVQEMNSAISTAIGSVNSFDMAVVQALPTENISTHTIYLVPKTGETNDVYDEYIYINNAWEMVGNTQIDLSNYVQKTDYATSDTAGVVKVNAISGLQMNAGMLTLVGATDNDIKAGNLILPRVTAPSKQHQSVFYGLAKAASDSTQSASNNAVGTYTNEAKSAIQQMLGVSSAADVALKADKADTVLDTTLSRGRKANTTVGTASIAFGVDAEASGYYSTALGLNTSAVSQGAFAEGKNTVARYIAHAEGEDTQALGQWAHSQGVGTVAKGAASFAGGDNTIANGHSSFVTGRYNVADSYDDWAFWAVNTSYNVGDKVKREQLVNSEPTIIGYICKEANTDETFDISHWDFDTNHMNYSVIVGNGYEAEDSETHETVRHGSNAYALDWDGNGYYKGDVYVGANANSSGGTKVATVNDIPDVSVYATKTDTILQTTLSRGRKANTTIGTGSFAFGTGVTASGYMSYAEGVSTTSSGQGTHAEGEASSASVEASHAEGISTTASNVAAHAEGQGTNATGFASHAEGTNTTASGYVSHAEGVYTTASGMNSHAEGSGTIASGEESHAEGVYTISNHTAQHVNGKYNIADPSQNTDGNYAEIIGNGTSVNDRSNAYALTWTGDGHYAGDVYVHSNANSTGGTKLITANDVPVTDVQVNGTSVLSDGVANVPQASYNDFGVVRVQQYGGLQFGSNGLLKTDPAAESVIKAGTDGTRVIIPNRQHQSTFYGLAKAAGSDEKNSTLSVGQYTDAAKSAIQSMLGVSDLIAPSEPTLVASQAYAVGDVFTANGKLYKVTTAIAAAETIVVQNEGEEVSGHNAEECKVTDYAVHDVQVNGTSVITDGVANIPLATTTSVGVVYPISNYGLNMNAVGGIYISKAADSDVKTGTNNYKPIVPVNQHAATFYGLAKAAGDTTQSQSSNAVGTYTNEAKAAIRDMLGAVGQSNIGFGLTAIYDPMTGSLDSIQTNVQDVQINNTSIIDNSGVANIPIASSSTFGVIKTDANSFGIKINAEGKLYTDTPSLVELKAGSQSYKPIVPATQHSSVFYGLAKAAGDATQSASSNAVGTYTDSAKASIKSMLGIVDGSTGTVDVTGTTPTITAVENTRYVCGEVATLTITPPASGICIIRFTSGTTATVLTATGIVWPEWFDATALEAERVYEICITDGYGAVMSWAL